MKILDRITKKFASKASTAVKKEVKKTAFDPKRNFYINRFYFGNSSWILLHDIDDECCGRLTLLYSDIDIGQYCIVCCDNILNCDWRKPDVFR